MGLEHEHRPPVVADLHHRVPATAERLPTLRRELTEWAELAGLDSADTEGLVLACYEAMANVVEHAYAGGIGVLDVRAAVDDEDSELTVTITDYGRWQPPSKEPSLLRGRGLPLIRTLSAMADVVPTAYGTTVRMRWQLPAVDATQGRRPMQHRSAHARETDEPMEQAADL